MNTATASGVDPNGDSFSDSDDETVSATQNPSIAVAKDRDGSGLVSVGDTVTYNIVATNNGDVTLTGVAVQDGLAGASIVTDGCTGATLAPTQSCTLTVAYTVTQDDVDAGSIVNTATASGVDPNGDSFSDSDEETVSATQNPSIAVAKDRDGSGLVSAGDTVTYNIVATNNGDVTLTGVTVQDGLAGASIVTDGCTGTTLAPTQSCTLTKGYLR